MIIKSSLQYMAFVFHSTTDIGLTIYQIIFQFKKFNYYTWWRFENETEPFRKTESLRENPRTGQFRAQSSFC